MEEFSIAIILAYVLISVYALYKLIVFFIKNNSSYSYTKTKDETGNEYDLVVDHNTKEKE